MCCFKVRMDEGGSSCSVRTTRKNGRIETTKAMLKYDRLSAQLVCSNQRKWKGWLVGLVGNSDRLMWGKSYYLQTDAYDRGKVYWKPLKNVPPYTWYRCGSVEAEEDWKEDWKEEAPEVVGSWRDDDGAIYKITMDETGWSCSATIERQDGRRYEARQTIKSYADGGERFPRRWDRRRDATLGSWVRCRSRQWEIPGDPWRSQLDPTSMVTSAVVNVMVVCRYG
eukprot:Skav220174  [mRNA]  locus=scaffold1271:52611:57047:+ [translate_table: standard]